MATKTVKVTTAKPTGLTITRNGWKFTLEWKIASDNYGEGQQLQYRYHYKTKKSNWKDVTIGKTTTAKTVTADSDLFIPSGGSVFVAIEFRVRGKRSEYQNEKKTKTYKPTWSDWSTKTWTVSLPNRPSLEAALDDDNDNVCKFSWDTTVDDTTHAQFTHTQWQTMLVADSTETDGSKLKWSSSRDGWDSGTSTRSSSKTITEDTTTLATGSHTRWFRIRSRGPNGASAWRYAKHVYAVPYIASIKKATAKLFNGVYRVSVTWKAGSSAAHPIDTTVVQYLIEAPAKGMTCPTSTGWKDANASADTSGNDKAVFNVEDVMEDDQCLWVRVVTQHDTNSSYSKGALAYKGNLADPSDISVETSDTTYKATITATNNSSVEDSFLAVYYKKASKPSKTYVVGIIPNGDTSVTVQCPNWSKESAISFGARAVVGSYKAKAMADGSDRYTVTAKMSSKKTIWDGGEVPSAPDNVELESTDTEGTIKVSWDWTWEDADSAELSWSTDPDAWESTNEPSTYTVSSVNAGSWNIAGLDIGQVWYVRVRLISGETYGPWSELASIDLSSTPSTPVLVLSESVLIKGGMVTASWGYVTTDGTTQAYAEICQATVSSDGITYGSIIAHTETAQHVDIYQKKVKWKTGTTHYLCVRVTSASGHVSEWSDPIPVTVAAPLECVIESTSLEEVTITDDDGNERTVTALTAMPLTATITGAGEGVTRLIIERAEEYKMDTPNEDVTHGYKGETIAVLSQNGEDEMTLEVEDLVGTLDDGAQYNLIAVVEDGLGQSAEETIPFEVRWSHQAEAPTAEVEIDETNLVAFITATAPSSYADGDVVDIYRLSADKPELIIQGGTFGTKYVDPYPAFGEYGGHRIVTRTANGDYITGTNQPAWIDLGENEDDYLKHISVVIDFDGNRVTLPFNITLSSSWSKDYQETQYLGGSVVGDWNLAVTRSMSASVSLRKSYDQEAIKMMRRLSAYPGICHVRTPEGSSFACDVQVSEQQAWDGSLFDEVAFSVSITRTDSQGFDGLTYDEWNG